MFENVFPLKRQNRPGFMPVISGYELWSETLKSKMDKRWLSEKCEWQWQMVNEQQLED